MFCAFVHSGTEWSVVTDDWSVSDVGQVTVAVVDVWRPDPWRILPGLTGGRIYMPDKMCEPAFCIFFGNGTVI